MRGAWLLLALICTISCERDRPQVAPAAQTKTINLYLFAAGYCIPCKEELPEIQRWYSAYKNKERVNVTVFLIAGSSPGKPATQELADSFKSSLCLDFDVKPDKYARLYKSYYFTGTAVPATVIADEGGVAIKTYLPGKVTGERLETDIGAVLPPSIF